MLSFIRNRARSTTYGGKFKYISCYLLSFPLPEYSTVKVNLNTSHVIFYRQTRSHPNISYIFKYISCYLLSVTDNREIRYCCEFKYISCYLLSVTDNREIRYCCEFKYISCYLLSVQGIWIKCTTT